MDKAKVLGLIVGIVGLAVLFVFLIGTIVEMCDTNTIYYYGQYGDNLYATSAILMSVAITLGATAMILYNEKRAAYFMALSTIIGAMGFVPVTILFHGYSLDIFFMSVTTFPMLISTILFFIPKEQRSKANP